MANWSAGYVADIGYTYGCYHELNPLRARLALLNASFACPEFEHACELGFGQGVSVNVHAAAGGARWFGTDFNPSQAAFARGVAAACGSDARLFDDAFADFCRRDDLPDFDFIGVHGIWSWISDENRAIVVDFVRRKLKVGGVLYVSYNTLPGWAAFAPLRHLMTEHSEVNGARGKGIVGRIDDALEFADRLMALNPSYARANPLVADRLKQVAKQNRQYLAHEYFNRDWHPMHFATMAKWLEPAKLSYACSANFLEHVAALNLTPAQRDFLSTVTDVAFRESVLDFMVNQQFRRDIWIKGPRALSPLERDEALDASRLILAVARADVPSKVNATIGEATLTPAIYGPIAEALGDNRVRSLGELVESAAKAGVHRAQVLEAAMVLVGTGHVCPAQPEDAIARARPQTDRFNRHAIERARYGNEIGYLASPVTGGGVAVGRVDQLFLQCAASGGDEPGQMTRHAWSVLERQNQRITKDGKVLETREENLAALDEQAATFAAKTAPLLRALQVA